MNFSEWFFAEGDEHQAFHKTIFKNIEDRTAPMVYADLEEESDRGHFAGFIRQCVEISQNKEAAADPMKVRHFEGNYSSATGSLIGELNGSLALQEIGRVIKYGVWPVLPHVQFNYYSTMHRVYVTPHGIERLKGGAGPSLSLFSFSNYQEEYQRQRITLAKLLKEVPKIKEELGRFLIACLVANSALINIKHMRELGEMAPGKHGELTREQKIQVYHIVRMCELILHPHRQGLAPGISLVTHLRRMIQYYDQNRIIRPVARIVERIVREVLAHAFEIAEYEHDGGNIAAEADAVENRNIQAINRRK